jgi:quinol monooxygenase YgiN
VYKNEAAVFAHLTNEPVLEALGTMGDFVDGELDISICAY